MRRRRVLLAGSAVLTAAISGCLEDDGDPEPTPTEDRTDNGEDTDPTSTPDENGNDDGGERDPSDDDDDDIESIEKYDVVAVAETFYLAWDDRDWDTIDALTYPGGIIDDNPEQLQDIQDGMQLHFSDAEVFHDGLAIFDTPSGVIEVQIDIEHPDGDTFSTTEHLVMVVVDDDLLVYDQKDQFNRLSFDDPDGPCPPESADGAEDNLPGTGEFYFVSGRASFGSAVASYRDADQHRYRVEMEVHDSVAQAEEVELVVEQRQVGLGDGTWDVEIGLLARYEHVTLEVLGDTEGTVDAIEGLFEETGCLGEANVVERSWE